MKTILSCAAVAVCFGVAHAAEAEICPEAIETQQSAKSVPYPFIPVTISRSSPLMGLTFFDGDPKGEASLAPDDEKHVGDTIVSTWTFPPGNERGTYLQCSFEGTRVVVQRKLDEGITTCKVTYDKTQDVGGLPFIRRIDCK